MGRRGFLLAVGCVFGMLLSTLAVQAGKLYGQSEIDRLVYRKDARTGLCFAYHSTGYATSGKAIATVDCEIVGEFLDK